MEGFGEALPTPLEARAVDPKILADIEVAEKILAMTVVDFKTQFVQKTTPDSGSTLKTRRRKKGK